MKIIINIALSDTGEHTAHIKVGKDIPLNIAINAIDATKNQIIDKVAHHAKSKGFNDFKDVAALTEFCKSYTTNDLKDDTDD